MNMKDEDLRPDDQFIRECSVKAISKILKRFQPEDFDNIYVKILGIYNKHYSPYAKEKYYKKNWNKND